MKNLFLILWVSFASCLSHPKIPISDTLENALQDHYMQYVSLLNRAYDNDTDALNKFLKIDYVWDAASYDHGGIVVELLVKCGDSAFYRSLNRLSAKELNFVSSYFRVGLEYSCDVPIDSIIQNYPKTYALLHRND